MSNKVLLLQDGAPVTVEGSATGQVLTWDQTLGTASFEASTSGTVTSVTGGTGLDGGTITDTGTLSVKYGTTAGTAAQGNDSRLSDARIPTGSAGGDLSGTYPIPTVAKIQNIPISTTDPTVGKILQYTGTEWAPADAPQGGSGGGGVMYYFNKGTSVSGGNLPANTYQLGRTAETGQTSVALTNLAVGSWTRVGGFVTDAGDPAVTTVPAGLWDFNLWAYTTAASNNQAYLRLTLYTYDGSTNPESGTVLAQTDNVYLYDANVTAQYIASMLIAGGTTLPSTSTRLYLLIEARASTTNRDVTVYFGNSTPTHTHSTIPSVGGTGIVHVVDGVFQSPATAVGLGSSDVSGILPATNGGTGQSSYTIGDLLYASGSTALSRLADVATGNALISGGVGVAPSWGKIGLTTHVSGVLPIANGGTNNGSLSVAIGSIYYGSGTQVTALAAGTSGQALQSGGAGAPSWVGYPYDLSAASVGTYGNSQTIFRHVAVRDVTITSTGSLFRSLTASSGTVTVTVQKNGVTAFSVTFSVAGGTTGSVPSGTTVTLAAGDVLTVVTPATADATLASVFFTLKATALGI